MVLALALAQVPVLATATALDQAQTREEEPR